MFPDRVSNPGLLTYESGALPIALRGPAKRCLLNRLAVSPSINSRISVARTLMARIPRLFRTRS